LPIYIVGGGLIGLLAAYELIHIGIPVVILERQKVGKESSWAGGGILSPLYPWRYPQAVNKLAQWGQSKYEELVQNLFAATGMDAQWLKSGILIFAEDDGGLALKWAQNHRVNLTRIPEEEVSAREPMLSKLGSALYMPDISQVRNPRLLAALRQELLQKGVKIQEQVIVSGFLYDRGRLTDICTAQGKIPADRCLVAAGAWTGGLLQDTNLALPIKPVRGQMLVLRSQPGHISHIILKQGHYLIPRQDGRILVGSTVEEAGFDRAITESARRELWAAARELVPSLKQCSVEHHWAGLRPGSPDGIPYIGEHPRVRGLFVCAGHFRNGIVLAPASVRLVTDLMLGRQPLFDPTPYQLPHA